MMILEAKGRQNSSNIRLHLLLSKHLHITKVRLNSIRAIKLTPKAGVIPKRAHCKKQFPLLLYKKRNSNKILNCKQMCKISTTLS